MGMKRDQAQEASFRTDLSVRCRCLSLNFSTEHAGFRSLDSLIVRNETKWPLQDVKVRALVPGFTNPADLLIEKLNGGEEREIRDLIKLEFLLEQIVAVAERVRVPLEIYLNGLVVHRQEVWLLSYNECSWQKGHEMALATFVQPNNSQIGTIVKQSLLLLKELTGKDSYRAVHESTQPDRIDKIAEAIFRCLKDHYNLTYDYEPPSWESLSQRVRFPDEVLADGRATCIDLALLFASTLEKVLVSNPAQPVLLILRNQMQGEQHALSGCWRSAPGSIEPIIVNRRQVMDWVEQGNLLLLDVTGVAKENPFGSSKLAFEECQARARAQLAQAQSVLGLNLAAIRPDYQSSRPGITPLPFLGRELPYGERALRALALARQVWESSPTQRIQSAHLLLGLLGIEGGAAAEFFGAIAEQKRNPALHPSLLSQYLIRKLLSVAAPLPMEYCETDSYSAAKAGCRQEARTLGALFVDDLHLLFALFRHPSEFLSKALKKMGASPWECLQLLEEMHPKIVRQGSEYLSSDKMTE